MSTIWGGGDLQTLALGALDAWDFSTLPTVKQINVSENATFLVQAGQQKMILRLCRRGYHTRTQLESELAWQKALSGIINVAEPITGRDGALVQFHGQDHWILFTHLKGQHPDPDREMVDQFVILGELAAKTHLHAVDWQRPAYFDRFSWDIDAILGEKPRWGRWRDAPNLSAADAQSIAQAEEMVRAQIAH